MTCRHPWGGTCLSVVSWGSCHVEEGWQVFLVVWSPSLPGTAAVQGRGGISLAQTRFCTERRRRPRRRPGCIALTLPNPLGFISPLRWRGQPKPLHGLQTCFPCCLSRNAGIYEILEIQVCLEKHNFLVNKRTNQPNRKPFYGFLEPGRLWAVGVGWGLTTYISVLKTPRNLGDTGFPNNPVSERDP